MNRNATARAIVLALTAGVAVPIAAPRAGRAAALPRHVQLERSLPAASDSVVASPDSLRLWFSEPIELRLTRVTLTSRGATIATGAPAQPAGERAAPVAVAVPSALAAGKYTVSWKTAGADGHAANGTYSFVVRERR